MEKEMLNLTLSGTALFGCIFQFAYKMSLCEAFITYKRTGENNGEGNRDDYTASILLLNNVIISSEGLTKEEQKLIYVAAKVLCQDCNGDWINGAKLIVGSRVSILCMDDANKEVVYMGSNKTNKKGEFEMILNQEYITGKEIIKQKLCTVKLVSSPNPYSYIPTYFRGGRLGVKLNSVRPSFDQQRPNVTKYRLGPFSYTTPLCDELDTCFRQETIGITIIFQSDVDENLSGSIHLYHLDLMTSYPSHSVRR
ncbi:hypothetical protein C5167_044344 [Papaver somniferum]|uniref:Uncharacterized protein n=1 Tax=Papaver somniferum TaxID=3469 RepID=A0A4Y7LAV4_PAPSO|nr:hypothetical protein C5167_044344 [Papaver somniferum]